ncbi:MAG: hypothetical protein K0S65_4120 [Labilithrix sp.]|nr:hypothetical protein [Labilithrix sp.]
MNRACLLVSRAALISIATLAVSCEKNDKPSSTNTSSAAPVVPTVQAATASEAKAAPASTAQPAGKAAVTWKDVGLATPESVLHDDASDVYLVSNVEGKATDADGKAFISKLLPDGTVATLKWIESGKNKVTLNAPKGMAIAGDLLYVADLDTLRIFDRKTGAPAGEVKIPGATFLNDVTIATDGRVLVSDTGVKAGAKGLESAGTDAIYAVEPGAKGSAKERKVSTLAKSKELGGPNGIAAHGDKIWVVTMNGSQLYSLDAKGKRSDEQRLPKGTLDGLFFIGDDAVLSSWDANAIYRGRPGHPIEVVIEDVKSPADIGYDKKRGRVLVPLFTENEVRAYDLK